MLGVVLSNPEITALLKERLSEPERIKEYGEITFNQAKALARVQATAMGRRLPLTRCCRRWRQPRSEDG